MSIRQMASQNQLQARIPTDYADTITSVARSREVPETDVEREVVEAGLESLGYLSKPTERHELWLYYARFVGLALGLAGLATMALGVFWGQITGVYGFSLLLIGFLVIATVDGLNAYTDRLSI